MLHGHGDDGYLYQKEIVADFSTNVWYGGEPVGLKEHLLNNWPLINKYPEVLAEGLIKKLASHHQLSTNSFLVNNGSTESIYLIAQAFALSKTIITVPAFSEYEDACLMYGHKLQFVNWNDLSPTLKIKAELLFLCNPNNPTGTTFSELEALVKNNSDTAFVIDEAFIEFTEAVQTAIPLIEKYPNLIILRSLTKAYAIPGLRLGYIAASSGIIAKLKALKYPWSVNSLAIEAGKFIFDNYDKIQIPLSSLLAEKDNFCNALKAKGISITESNTHFFLAETPESTASALKEYLVNNFGILIRDASNFRTLSAQHFRLATLSANKNKLLIKAIEGWMNRRY